MVVKVHQLKNEPPETQYAPLWDFVIAEKETDLDVDELGYIILSKEKEIIEEYPEGWANQPVHDGYTGLGTDSLTSRFKYFNVLKWDYPVCKQLHKQIIEFHDEYVQGTRKPRLNNLKIRCWANVMSKGDKIPKHHHGSFAHSYLSGNFAIKCEDTSTNYFHPYDNNEMYPIKNKPGHMHLFPSWLPHDTSMHKGDSERVIIAFDIYLEHSPLAALEHEGELIELRL